MVARSVESSAVLSVVLKVDYSDDWVDSMAEYSVVQTADSMAELKAKTTV